MLSTGDGRRSRGLRLVLLLASLLAIPLPRQGCLHAFFLTRLQVVGVALYFLDDVLLLDLPFEAAQRVFQRLAFLYTNFCQKLSTSKPAMGASNHHTGNGLVMRGVGRSPMPKRKTIPYGISAELHRERSLFREMKH